MGFSGVVLLHFPGPAAAAHADVLQRAAKTRRLVPLKMGQGDKHIGVHHRPADLGIFHIFATGHRYLSLIVALDAIGDNHLAPGGHGIEPIEHSGVQMIQAVLASAHIEGVAVCQKRLAAPLLHEVRHGFSPS